jgi:hypothetical protein
MVDASCDLCKDKDLCKLMVVVNENCFCGVGAGASREADGVGAGRNTSP